MADSSVPAVTGSKSFDDVTPAVKNTHGNDEENKNRTYSLDDSLGVSNNGEEEDEDEEDEEDEEIRLAKEMALAIAENPNMTPDQLREIQEQSKKRAAAAASKGKKKKGVKALRSSIKAGVKAVSNVATGRKSPQRTLSSSSNTPSPASLSLSSKVNAIPSASNHKIPAAAASPAVAGRKIAVQPKVGEFPDGRKDMRKESVSDVDSGTAVGSIRSTNDSSIRLTGIVWKRRSGLGKYSSNAAWERRRVVLEGTKLLYYKTSSHDSDDASVDESNHEDLSANDAMHAGSNNWLGMRSSSSSSKPTARGDFDLRKEQASVAASYGHTGAPTPFAISIKVLGQTKWKLCFDTHEELMEWLAAMTDIVVQGSVDTYNALILEAHDPRNNASGSSGGTVTMYGQLSEPPPNLSPQYAEVQEAVGGHRLWATGHYYVKSVGFQEAAMAEMEDILEDVDSDEDEDVQMAEAGDSLIGKKVDVVAEGPKDIWGIPSQQLLPMVVVLNVALCLSRASTVSADMFWHLITFTNIALLGILSKERVAEKATSAVTSQKLAKKMSAGLGRANTPDDTAMSAGKKPAAKELAIPEPNDDYKPVAGTTTIEIENPTDLPIKDGVIFGGWRTADPSTMMIRSVGYKSHKKKCASPGELYECIHIDIFESKTRYPDMASRVTLPTVTYQDKSPKTWNAPDLFVITIAIPTDPPKLYGSADNGGGYTISMYYKMHQETREILRRVTADGYKPGKESEKADPNTSKVNAVRLLEEWCRRAPTDDNFMARFKVVPNAQNLKEIGLPSWIAKYNGKPFLIKRPGQTGFLYRHPEKSCIEFDISLHPFPYLAKQGICYMKDTFFKKVLVTFGFLIEGRNDDELPECLIGLFQLVSAQTSSFVQTATLAQLTVICLLFLSFLFQCYRKFGQIRPLYLRDKPITHSFSFVNIFHVPADPQHAIQGEDFFAGTSPKSF
jgi:Protein ENHANCED DISEASE RESISTANCE 2, C-terminal/PH domain